MITDAHRAGLREACRFFGGIRAVARRTGLNDGNLGRWLQGYPTLSEAKIAELQEALGFVGGLPKRDVVHEWRMDGVIRGDYASAFRLYFPAGAEVAAASWSQPGFRELVRRVRTSDRTPEVIAITDGRVRAVVRSPSNILLQPKNMGNVLTWRGGDRNSAILNIEKGDPVWCQGPLSIQEFDRVWGAMSEVILTIHDVMSVIQEQGLTYEQAIIRLRKAE